MSALTLRNWLIGCYSPSTSCAARTRPDTVKSCWRSCPPGCSKTASAGTEKRELRRYRQFYQTYPQIRVADSRIGKLPRLP